MYSITASLPVLQCTTCITASFTASLPVLQCTTCITASLPVLQCTTCVTASLPVLQCITCRVVVSVSTSRSRDGLETYQRLVSVSSREKLSTSRSRLGLERQTSRSRLGLGQLRLVPKINFRPNCAGHINKTYAV